MWTQLFNQSNIAHLSLLIFELHGKSDYVLKGSMLGVHANAVDFCFLKYVGNFAFVHYNTHSFNNIIHKNHCFVGIFD